jgi:AcrR family transcriptional regulator
MRGDLPREFVELHQRRRAAVALADLAHERGVAAVTTSAICQRARMSRTTFYALFATVSNCRRFAFAEAYERLFGAVAETTEGGSWPQGLRAAVDSFFTAIVTEPLAAELCLVHSREAAAEAGGLGFEAAVEAMTEVIQGGREAGRAALGERYRDPPLQVEEFLAGAIVSLAALRVRQGEARLLPTHRAEMVQLAATPFLGAEQAEAPHATRR